MYRVTLQGDASRPTRTVDCDLRRGRRRFSNNIALMTVYGRYAKHPAGLLLLSWTRATSEARRYRPENPWAFTRRSADLKCGARRRDRPVACPLPATGTGARGGGDHPEVRDVAGAERRESGRDRVRPDLTGLTARGTSRDLRAGHHAATRGPRVLSDD